MRRSHLLVLFTLLALLPGRSEAFCGFYVAKGDARIRTMQANATMPVGLGRRRHRMATAASAIMTVARCAGTASPVTSA